ncbi:MAG: hypothetical protein AAGD35_19600 [Actinomycetota bacterium]
MATIKRSTPSPWVMRIMNPLVRFMVGRGWGSVSDRVMVLHWTGRKSGTAYATPVSRLDIDGRLFTKTRAGYKHNFVGGGPAELILDGKRRRFTGTVIDEPDAVGHRMRSVLDARGIERGARSLGLAIEGDPTIDELAAFAAADGAVVIDFTPA